MSIDMVFEMFPRFPYDEVDCELGGTEGVSKI